VRDPEGHLYQVKFDPAHRPGDVERRGDDRTTVFHAIGYNVAEVYLVEFDPTKTVIAEGATISDGGGRERRLVKKDIEDALAEAARLPNGKYRGVASVSSTGRRSADSGTGVRAPTTRTTSCRTSTGAELRALRVFGRG